MTPRQEQLFNFIEEKINRFGKAPTFKEMRDFLNVTSNQTIEDILSLLERDSYIVREKGEFRGIKVTNKATLQKNQTPNIKLGIVTDMQIIPSMGTSGVMLGATTKQESQYVLETNSINLQNLEDFDGSS